LMAFMIDDLMTEMAKGQMGWTGWAHSSKHVAR
jgi:hypothetical protein